MSNTQIKFLKSLHKNKYRNQHKKIILEGHRLISQALTFGAKMEKIWVTDEYQSSNQFKEVEKYNENFLFDVISKQSIKKVTESKNNQGIIALTSFPKYKKIVDYPRQSVYLDRISDPGNMGTLLRTASWFGIKDIFLSTDCVDVFNSKVIRAAMGAHFYLNRIIVLPFDNMKRDDLFVIAGDLKGESLEKFHIPKNKKWILVLGSEAHGISSYIKSFITHSVTIKANCDMESLNVVSAGSILLNHLVIK